jgi:hypothetical protein
MKKNSARLPFTTAAAIIVLAGMSLDAAQANSEGEVELRLLSSPPQYLSGCDARIEVRAARGLHKH